MNTMCMTRRAVIAAAMLSAAAAAFSPMAGCLTSCSEGKVCPSSLFSQNMVLQCDRPIPVWGKAKPGAQVAVTFAGKTTVATADERGDWLAKLPAEKASAEPRTMTIGLKGGKAVEFPGVLVGDVFVSLGGNEAEVRTRRPCSSETVRLFRCKCDSMTPSALETGGDKWFKPQDVKGGTDLPDLAWRFAEKWAAKSGRPCGMVIASTIWREWSHYMPIKAFCVLPPAEELPDPKSEYTKYISTLQTIARFGERVGGTLPAAIDDDSAYAGDEPTSVTIKYGETYNGLVRPLAHGSFLGGFVVAARRKPHLFTDAEWSVIYKTEVDCIRSEFDVQFPILKAEYGDRDAEAEKLVAQFMAGPKNVPAQKPKLVADPPAFTPPAFEVSPALSSHMVFQRRKPIPVWGKAKPGETVTVRFGGAEAKATADKNGDWMAKLPKFEASFEPRTLEVIPPGGAPAVKFDDILVGDVWMAAGQSNMEMTFNWGVHNKDEVIAQSESMKWIRRIKLPHTKSLTPAKFRTPGGSWCVCDKEGTPEASAAGYWFARRIGQEIGIPIGIIDTSWSGSPIEPFIPLCGMKSEQYCDRGVASAIKHVTTAAKLGADAARRIAAGESVLDAFTFDSQFSPSSGGNWGVQYNAMIEPIIKYPLTGIIWFQGCSNKDDKQHYRDLQRALVKGWREKYGEELPFYITQLSSFKKGDGTPEGGDGFSLIREAQREVVPQISKCGLVVTTDVGDEGDIHFRNKIDVGDRLALWALRDVYGKKDVQVSGPWFKEMRLEGAAARIFFDYVYGGLMAAERDPQKPLAKPERVEKLSGFSLQDAAGKWHFADAKIDGETVVVTAPGVTEARNVRYAYHASTLGEAHPQCRANLYGVNGLPAVPFKTDPWEEVSK